MNMGLLLKEARRLLQTGTVPLRRDHLYRGRKGNFCISTEVLDGLQAHFSSRAKQMLLDYRARLVGQERGDADGGGQELAGLRLENAMLRSVCSNVARQNVATKSGFNTLVKTQRSSRWLQLRRTITKLRKEKCRPQEFEFPDGTRAVPLAVKNVVHDPFAERPEEKGTRMATFCWDWAVLVFKGNKEKRPGGGWRWTLEARLNEFLHYLRQRADSARGATWLREAFMANQTMKMLVVPTAMRGYKRRIKLPCNGERTVDGFRLLTYPSRQTTSELIIPAFTLLFSLEAAKLVADPRTVRIGFCCDGAKLKGYGCVGAVVSVYWSEPDFIDRFDNVRYKTTCWRFKLPLVRTPNKIVRALRNCNGSEFPPQAAYAVAKALYAGNMAVSLLKYPHLWVFCVDGASENTGTTSSFAKTVRDNLCSSNSIYEQLVLSQDIWLKVYEDAKASGLQGPLDAFFGKGDFEYPAAGRVLGPPLDTSGPVLKDPKTVVFLRKYQADATKRLIESLGLMRYWFAQWWRSCRWAQLQGPARPGNTRRPRTKEGDRWDPAHRNEFLRRLQMRRVLAIEYDQKCLDELDNEDEAKRNTGQHMSMQKNPIRFLPGLCQPDGSPLGQVGWCGNHRGHNLSDPLIEYLNKDILLIAVSLTKYLRCEYHWPGLCAAMNHLLKPEEAAKIDSMTDFFKTVLASIDKDELMKQCGFDEKRGAAPPVIAALTRWGTAFGSLSYLFKNRKLIAFAMIRCSANGLNPVILKAAIAVFSKQGFDSAVFPDLQMEKHAELHFNFLTSVSDHLQMAIGHVLDVLVVKPLLAAVSANHGCGAPLTMGLESKIRAILKIFRRDLFVRAFARCGWGRGWKCRLAIGHRTDGAEYQPDPSLRLLNPKAGDAVRRRLGYWPEMQGLVDEAAGAITTFLEAAKECAGRKGPMLPGDSLAIWKACVAGPKMLDADFYEDSYAARMSQAQWLFIQTAENAARCITVAMQRELYAISGVIANMGKTRKVDVVLSQQGGTSERATVLVPDTFSKANAVVALVMGRDLLSYHVKKDGLSVDEVLKRLPTYARAWSEEGLNQLMQYIETDRTGIKAQIVDAEGCVDLLVRRGGKPTPWASAVLAKTVSAYSVLDKCSQEAANILATSSPCESAFSMVSVIGKMKGFLGMESTDMLFRKLNYYSCRVDPAAVMQTPHLYWEAERLVQLPGWREWVFGRDNRIGDMMRQAQMEADLPKCVKRGSNFKTTNHGGTSRTPRFFKAENGASNKEGKALHARIARITARHGIEWTNMLALQAKAKKIRKAALSSSKRKKTAPKKTAALSIANKNQKAVHCTSAKTRNASHRSAVAKVAKVRSAAPGSKKRRKDSLDELDDIAYMNGDGAADLHPVDTEEPCVAEPPAKKLKLGDGDGSVRRSAGLVGAEVKSGGPQVDEPSATHQPVTRKGTKGAGSNQVPRKRVAAPTPKTRRRQGKVYSDVSADSDGKDSADEEVKGAPVTRRGLGGVGSAFAHGDSANANPAGADLASGASVIRPAALAERSAGLQVKDGANSQAPRIGARVEIKWDPQKWAADRNGWCQGVVTAISNGKLRAPGQREKGKATVKAGYSIIEYDGGDEIVHLLDRAHHVSVFGDKETAWRLLAGPEDEDEDETEDDDLPIAQRLHKLAGGASVRNSNGGSQGAGAKGIQAAMASIDSDEDRPLLRLSLARPAGQGSARSEQNIWSLGFTFKRFGCNAIRLSTAKYFCGMYDISREIDGCKMSFRLEPHHPKMHYIFHTEETGPMLVCVICIVPPKNDDFSNTVEFYCVHTTREALRRVDSDEDKIDERNALVAMGGKSLQKQLDEDQRSRRVTYHAGDRAHWGDARRIIGAVRWARPAYRDCPFPTGYWKVCKGACRTKTSIIYYSSPFSEGSAVRRSQSDPGSC
jgi:hypothetical protein